MEMSEFWKKVSKSWVKPGDQKGAGTVILDDIAPETADDILADMFGNTVDTGNNGRGMKV